MSAPKRIRLSRAKGWRLPAAAVAVTRPGRWGNPFKVGEWVQRDSELAPYIRIPGGWGGLVRVKILDPAAAVEAYAAWLIETPEVLLNAMVELRGRDLACWCLPSAPCHADVLLELVNA